MGIALGNGSDIALEAARMTILSSDLRKIPAMLRLARLTVRTIRQNLFWAFVYNLVGVPVAAGVFYPLWGFLLDPMIAGAAMAMSSVSAWRWPPESRPTFAVMRSSRPRPKLLSFS